MSRPVSRIVTAGVVTAVTDGLFSSVLNVAAYHSTVTRLWQGVAAVPLGPSALGGGLRTAAIGLAIHVVVAFAWSTVFFVLLERGPWLARLVDSRYGAIKAAALYGPFVWMMMSLVIIPAILHRPPAITFRWWVQFFGHIPFVGYPIASTLKTDN